MERTNGYVVGRKSAYGISTWAVKVRQRGHELEGQKILVASIAKGVTLSNGLDVDFFVGSRSGQTMATDVAPKGVASERKKEMTLVLRKWSAGLTVALILAIFAVGVAFKLHRYEPIRNFIVETRAEWALDSIRKLTADQIITDEVVRAAVRDSRWSNLRGASWAAREAVFADHQCPIFNIGYEDVDEVCNTARYSERTIEGNVWYERVGIPVSIAPTIVAMRTELYRIGRVYLVSPANLRAVYEAKKGVVVDEFRRLSDEDKQKFKFLISAALESFSQFRDDEAARAKYASYIHLENVWRADKTDSLDPFSAWQDQGQALQERVADIDLYLFAGRRHAEGGDELVSAYIEIAYDLLGELAAAK